MGLEYWQRREIRTQEALLDRSISSLQGEMKRIYKQTAEQIIQEMTDTYRKILTGNYTANDIYQMRRYYDMLNQLNTQLTQLGTDKCKAFSSSLTDLYNNEYKLTGDNYNLPPSATNTLMVEHTENILNTAWSKDAMSLSDRIWKQKDILTELLREQLINSVVAGHSVGQFKRLLMEQFNADYYCADRLVRTEMSHIYNQASVDRYADGGIEQYEWLAELDSRTCDICMQMDGKRFPVTDTQHIPPNYTHPNCRCTIIPVINAQ